VTLTSEQAREMGKRSAVARRERPAFPPLDSPANAKLRLAHISNLELAGRITSTSANSQERVHRCWLEVWAAEVDLQRLKALERRVRELEDELERSHRSVRRAS
jgi:hypothetical protein